VGELRLFDLRPQVLLVTVLTHAVTEARG